MGTLSREKIPTITRIKKKLTIYQTIKLFQINNKNRNLVNFVALGSKHHKYIKISFENHLHFSSAFQGQSGMSHGKAAIKV